MRDDVYPGRLLTLQIKGKLVDLSTPAVMGIVNCTPDSFYAGSRRTAVEEAVSLGVAMAEQGALFVDVGGQSTRPGASQVGVEEELERVMPVVEQLVKKLPASVTVSIDTFYARVAQMAVATGAGIVNDISGGMLDSSMYDTVAALGVPYILTHTRGNPATMAKHAVYEDLLQEVLSETDQRILLARAAGISQLIIDPGFGFAKTVDQNFELLRHLPMFSMFRLPILVGLSRKSMVWKTLQTTPENALNGSTVLHTLACIQGASILRVHDVAAAAEVVLLTQKTLPLG
jgi:dihydropteroate synthase